MSEGDLTLGLTHHSTALSENMLGFLSRVLPAIAAEATPWYTEYEESFVNDPELAKYKYFESSVLVVFFLLVVYSSQSLFKPNNLLSAVHSTFVIPKNTTLFVFEFFKQIWLKSCALVSDYGNTICSSFVVPSRIFSFAYSSCGSLNSSI